MHLISTVLLLLGALLFLVVGLVDIVDDLLARSPHAAPLLHEVTAATTPDHPATGIKSRSVARSRPRFQAPG